MSQELTMYKRPLPGLLLVFMVCWSTAFAVCDAAEPTALHGAVNKAFLLIGMRANATKLLKATPWSPKLESIATTAHTLQSIYAISPVVSKSYLTSLRYDAALLKNAQNNPDSASTKADVQFVSEDLDAKLNFARAQSGQFAESLGTDITLQVVTVRNGIPVNGFDVRCNPRRFADSHVSMFPFPDQTSPAQRGLPPGIFTIAVTRRGKVISEKDVELGSDGRTLVKMIIDVP